MGLLGYLILNLSFKENVASRLIRLWVLLVRSWLVFLSVPFSVLFWVRAIREIL